MICDNVPVLFLPCFFICLFVLFAIFFASLCYILLVFYIKKMFEKLLFDGKCKACEDS